jgi:hypothetical protein
MKPTLLITAAAAGDVSDQVMNFFASPVGSPTE